MKVREANEIALGFALLAACILVSVAAIKYLWP